MTLAFSAMREVRWTGLGNDASVSAAGLGSVNVSQFTVQTTSSSSFTAVNLGGFSSDSGRIAVVQASYYLFKNRTTIAGLMIDNALRCINGGTLNNVSNAAPDDSSDALAMCPTSATFDSGQFKVSLYVRNWKFSDDATHFRNQIRVCPSAMNETVVYFNDKRELTTSTLKTSDSVFNMTVSGRDLATGTIVRSFFDIDRTYNRNGDGSPGSALITAGTDDSCILLNIDIPRSGIDDRADQWFLYDPTMSAFTEVYPGLVAKGLSFSFTGSDKEQNNPIIIILAVVLSVVAVLALVGCVAYARYRRLKKLRGEEGSGSSSDEEEGDIKKTAKDAEVPIQASRSPPLSPPAFFNSNPLSHQTVSSQSRFEAPYVPGPTNVSPVVGPTEASTSPLAQLRAYSNALLTRVRNPSSSPSPVSSTSIGSPSTVRLSPMSSSPLSRVESFSAGASGSFRTESPSRPLVSGSSRSSGHQYPPLNSPFRRS
jgi:hypothetical protein